jgi:hypothetical protein
LKAPILSMCVYCAPVCSNQYRNMMSGGYSLVRFQGSMVGWLAKWRPERAFPIDMAAMAINVKAVRKRGSSFDTVLWNWKYQREAP